MSKFSELLTEYLQLEADERDADTDWEPIQRRSDRRERKQELLDAMDALIPAKETP